MLQLNNTSLANLAGNIVNYQQTTLNIYSGEMPIVDAAFVFNPSNYTAQRLATMTISAPSPANGSSRQILITGVNAKTFNGLQQGVATWFAIYFSSTPGSYFTIGTVSSDPATKSTLLIDNANIEVTSNFPYSLVNFSCTLN